MKGVAVEPVARLCSQQRAQAARAARGAAGLADRAARRRRLPAGGRRDVLRERAREGALRPDASSRATWVIGEDSGIEVDGLDGRPGVALARASAATTGRAAARGARRRRRARPRRATSASWSRSSPDGDELRGTGTLEGRIADEPRGSEGFGYDPIFVPDGEERTVAELGNEWKRTHSHRARAAATSRESCRRSARVGKPVSRCARGLSPAPGHRARCRCDRNRRGLRGADGRVFEQRERGAQRFRAANRPRRRREVDRMVP